MFSKVDQYFDYCVKNERKIMREVLGFDDIKLLEIFSSEYKERFFDVEEDLQGESLLLFYEKSEMYPAFTLREEVENVRFRLKSHMVVDSISRRVNVQFSSLDIMDFGSGCGSASISIALAFGCKVFSYDVSPMLKIQERKIRDLRLEDNVTLIDPLVSGLPVDERYDIVICFETLEHLYDPLSYIVRFNRALKKDGFMYLTYSFGPALGHLKTNRIYHENFHNRVSELGFTEELKRRGMELRFPIHIFRKEDKI